MTTPTQIPIVPGLSAGTVKGSDVYPAVDTTDTTQSSYGSTKAYTIAQLYSFIITGLGFNVYSPTLAGTTANLNATYANGVFGVGASLTNAGTLAPFSVDGQTGVLNGRYLVKNQTNPAENGIYYLTTVGSITIPWILTRASDCNSSSNIINQSIVYITGGTVGANTVWQLNFSGSVVVGTTALDWNAFTLTPFVGFTWNTITGVAHNLVNDNGYVPTNVSQTVFTLPTVSSVGDTYIIKGYGSGGWRIAQNASQQIILGSSSSTIGITGYIESTNRYDDIEVTCIIDNVLFKAGPPQGNITVN